MFIRQLLSADASDFQSLRLRGLLECPEAFSSSHAEESDTPLEVVSQRLTPKPDGAVFGGFLNGALAGIVGVQRENQVKLSHKAVVWGMYVAPECRLKGGGRSLVEKAIEYAATDLGVRLLQLGVNARNQAAVALYTAMGFKTFGTEEEFMVVEGVAHHQYLMSRHV